ncbi:hypothetical protein F4808DRAFT_466063 [Astrocystis sublimbata]|nr:hypothetical protein F4808DRAFT_466063 [Astrocystis sublimbata]
MATSVDAKLLRATKFPPEFNQKVDMQKVNLQVMKKWIASRISEILGSEDDVVIELCFNLIDGPRFPDIKSLQIQLTGFLDKDTAPFCKELWKLCLSAQSSPQGVPKELLEAKKLELIQEKIDADKAAEEARIENDETVASVEAEGTIGGEADAAEIELSMIVGALDVVQAEVHLLPEEIATPIKQIETATSPKDVEGAGKTSDEAALLAAHHPRPRGVPLDRGRQDMPTDALVEAVCDRQVHLDTVLAIDLHRAMGSASDRLTETGILEAVTIEEGTTHRPPITVPIRERVSPFEPLSILLDISIQIAVTVSITVSRPEETAIRPLAIADGFGGPPPGVPAGRIHQISVEDPDAEEAQLGAEAETEMLARLLTGLAPPRAGEIPASPIHVATDALIFRKMKINPDHAKMTRPRRPRRPRIHSGGPPN